MDAVVHACNPSAWELEAVRIKSSKPSSAREKEGREWMGGNKSVVLE